VPGQNLITHYFRTVRQILTQPTAFFRTMPLSGGMAGPLAFALVTHWLGSSIGYLWRLLIGGGFGGSLTKMFTAATDVAEIDNPGRHAEILQLGERIQHWIWGVGSIVADPFLTLLRILFIAFMVWLGARILVTPGQSHGQDEAPREITFESAVRVVAYGLTPSILSALPILGGAIASFYVAAVTVIGARETYRIGTGRATVVALFPQFLLLLLVVVGLFAMAALFFGVMSAVFR
jgi:hypothetical protein